MWCSKRLGFDQRQPTLRPDAKQRLAAPTAMAAPPLVGKMSMARITAVTEPAAQERFQGQSPTHRVRLPAFDSINRFVTERKIDIGRQ